MRAEAVWLTEGEPEQKAAGANEIWRVAVQILQQRRANERAAKRPPPAAALSVGLQLLEADGELLPQLPLPLELPLLRLEAALRLEHLGQRLEMRVGGQGLRI